MRTSERRPKSPAAVLTAWVALLVALYSAFAVATFWGALGGFAGGFGAWMSIVALRQRPGLATRVIAVVALAVNVLAFSAAALILVLVLAGEA
jgi:hypothetical protein